MKKILSFFVLSFALMFFVTTQIEAREDEGLLKSTQGVEKSSSVKDELELEIELENDLDDELDLEDVDDSLDDLDDELDDLDEDKVEGIGEEHRSKVADSVNKLLNVADHNGKLGEEIRKIAHEQASSSDDVLEAIDKIEHRNKLKTFLIGTDYKNLGALRSEIAKTEARLEALKREMEKLIPLEQTVIETEISKLEDEQDKLESFVEDNEDHFSLFGWAIKLFQ